MSCSRPQCSSPNGGDTSRIAMSLIYYNAKPAGHCCWQCGWRTEAPSNGLRKYHRRERTTTRRKTEDGTTEDGQSRGLLKFNSRLVIQGLSLRVMEFLTVFIGQQILYCLENVVINSL